MRNSNGISVIIAHYAPPINTNYYRNILKKTIQSIRSQKVDFDVEIIVCDDGSAWSGSLATNKGITELDESQIKSSYPLNDLDVNRYLLLPDSGKYLGIVLKHRAFEIANYNKIVVLDDDHPFIKNDSLSRYDNYLEKYEFVRGRLIGPTGIPKLFSSKNVQGSNYGLKRELYFSFGGYADFLFVNANNEDADIHWQVYKKLAETYPGQKKACFAGEIVTKDLASNRWVERSENSALGELRSSGESTYPNKDPLVDSFIAEYGVNPYDNPSRNKSLWMEIPSLKSWISEIKYIPLHYYYKYLNLLRLSIHHAKTKEGRVKIKEYLLNKR
jgi:hypothetical protein